MGVGTEVAAGCVRTDIVHSHTSYANRARAGRPLLHGGSVGATTHCLECGSGVGSAAPRNATQRLPNLGVAG